MKTLIIISIVISIMALLGSALAFVRVWNLEDIITAMLATKEYLNDLKENHGADQNQR